MTAKDDCRMGKAPEIEPPEAKTRHLGDRPWKLEIQEEQENFDASQSAVA